MERSKVICGVAMSMVLIVVVFLCLVGLHGCATTGLPPDATPTQKQQAYCQDAVNALVISNAALSGFSTATNNQYWQAWNNAAKAYVNAYCVGTPPVTIPAPSSYTMPPPAAAQG